MTPVGLRLIDSTYERVEARAAELFHTLPEQDRRSLLRIIRSLNEAMAAL